jgi:hypothetical protein
MTNALTKQGDKAPNCQGLCAPTSAHSHVPTLALAHTSEHHIKNIFSTALKLLSIVNVEEGTTVLHGRSSKLGPFNSHNNATLPDGHQEIP